MVYQNKQNLRVRLTKPRETWIQPPIVAAFNPKFVKSIRVQNSFWILFLFRFWNFYLGFPLRVSYQDFLSGFPNVHVRFFGASLGFLMISVGFHLGFHIRFHLGFL